MKTSDYPRDWKFDKDGKTVAGAYRELRPVTVESFETGQPVEKIVLELELDNGEPVSVWLGERNAPGKLLNLFIRELKLRRAHGKSDFEPRERITITQSDEQRPSKKTQRMMWDWSVTFEHAAPPPTAADVLLGDPGPENDPADPGAEVDTAADADGDVPF